MKTLILSVLLLTGTTAFSKTEKWILDTSHTKIRFEIPHLVISTVEGAFKVFTGDIQFDGTNPEKGKKYGVNVSIQAKSIDTGDAKRDKHLRSPDFFNVKKFPKITFKSTSFTVKKKNIEIVGDLKIAGKSKKVTLKGKFLGKVSAYEVERIAFSAKTKVNVGNS